MFRYGKLAQSAIAAVSYLAWVAPQRRLVPSPEIAEARDLSRVLVAKILTLLSHAGLVRGKSGPAGGYELCRAAEEISLLDVVRVFEDPEQRVMCPFGPHWCGVGPNCPLHETLMEMQGRALERLAAEDFGQFKGTAHEGAGLSGLGAAAAPPVVDEVPRCFLKMAVPTSPDGAADERHAGSDYSGGLASASQRIPIKITGGAHCHQRGSLRKGSPPDTPLSQRPPTV